MSRLSVSGVPAVTLADEALPHLRVLICFMAAFCEANACQFVEPVEVFRESANGPHLTWSKELAKEVNDFLLLFPGEVYFGVRKESLTLVLDQLVQLLLLFLLVYFIRANLICG